MPKKLPRAWRGVFLRALRGTGNVRASAARAGVDPGTAYDHRIKDAGFEAKWEAALGAFRAAAARGPLHHGASRRGPPVAGRPVPRTGLGLPGAIQPGTRPGEELIARRSKNHGVQMVRAAVGRWDTETEAIFLAGVRETGCVRAAADAAGLSTTAFYNRRANYPDFAERWDAMLEESKTRVPELLNAATIASLDPGVPKRGRRLPKVNVDQAIRISQMNQRAAAAAAGGRGRGGRMRHAGVATNAEVREALLKRLAAFRQRIRDRRAGKEEGLGGPDEGDAPEPGQE